MKSKTKAANGDLEVCILAGGLSERMGRDKSRLRLGRNTMLSLVRKSAKTTGLPVRVIRRDLVPRCGPLGGIYTGLKTAGSENVLFLACDMPFLTRRILLKIKLTSARNRNRAVFLGAAGRLGFPILLPRSALDAVAGQITKGQFSLHLLAKALHARVIRTPRKWVPCLANINTARDLEGAKRRFLRIHGTRDACQSYQT